MSALIVVPARYGSTRLPAKPLHMIAGRTLLARVAKVAERAARQTGSACVVATDHAAIMDHCRELGIAAVMTDPELRSGSDRALAAAVACGANPSFVLNLQGDAPFTDVSHLVEVLKAGAAGGFDVVTPVVRLDWPALDRLREHKLEAPFSGTTCLRAPDGRAYWFSKTIVPAIRDEAKRRATEPVSPVFQHIGLYGYRMAALERFTSLPASPYETTEGLEQLRFLENGMSILAVEVKAPRIASSGIDSPEDVRAAERAIAEFGDPYEESAS